MSLESLNKVINEATEVKEEDINIKELNKESLAKLIPTLEGFEIEFYAECTDEVGGSIDYVYGGLTGTHVETEGNTGYITFDHPFIKQGEGYTTIEDEWEVECSWSTDMYFEVHEKATIETLDQLYDFIIDLQQYFDEFELQKIYR